MQSGVVREMQLTVTGHKTWSGSQLKIVSRHVALGEFNYEYGTAAWGVAVQANQGGCFDIHP